MSVHQLRAILHVAQMLVLTGFTTSGLAQEVSVPDPGLNAAIRDALQKPTGPLTVQLAFPQQQPIGAFRFGITGPPGVYTVYSSSNLTTWDAVNFVDNPLGSIFFTDIAAHLSPQKFYRVVRQTPLANMVFIAANTFIMGSPTNELHRQANEGPQTAVTLTRGFWIGKYEVTQGE